MNLDKKVQEAIDIIGIVFMQDPDEMSAVDLRINHKKAMGFIFGVLVGNILTTDKLKELGDKLNEKTQEVRKG